MEPKLINPPIDFELAALLGETPADFVVLYADGTPMQGYGTPFDSELARDRIVGLIEMLNDTSEDSFWPEFFRNWEKQFRAMYDLPPDTTAQDFHPVFSFAIHRVCAGYSEHLHVAMRLFETCRDSISRWHVGRASNGTAFVEIRAKRNAKIIYTARGGDLPMMITLAVKELLTDLAR